MSEFIRMFFRLFELIWILLEKKIVDTVRKKIVEITDYKIALLIC
jgi:hypothetical protein